MIWSTLNSTFKAMKWKNPFDLNGDGQLSAEERRKAISLQEVDVPEFDEALEKLASPQELKRIKKLPAVAEMKVKRKGFFSRLFKKLKIKATFNGQTKVGRIAGGVLDIAGLIFPAVGTARKGITKIINPNKKEKPMLDIIKRVFTTSNGGFLRLWDELEGRDLKYYIAFAVRAILIVGLFYLADYLGLPIDKIITAIFGGG